MLIHMPLLWWSVVVSGGPITYYFQLIKFNHSLSENWALNTKVIYIYIDIEDTS